MKLSKIRVLLLTVLVLLLFTAVTGAEEPITIKVKGVTVRTDQSVLIVNGRTMVPVRFVSEALGAKVVWDANSRTVIISSHDNSYVTGLEVTESIKIMVNGRLVQTDQQPLLIGNRTMVPVRFISEALGVEVGWDQKRRTVLIGEQEQLASAELEPKEVAEMVGPAVIHIEIYDEELELSGKGSGFIVGSKGVIVTNYHVINGASFLRVKLGDGREFSVEQVLNFNEERDIAVLKIDANELPTVKLGDSNGIVTGEKILTISSPLGLENSISEGLVNNNNRIFNEISAPVSPGSSGGVLLNYQGEVVGVISASILSGQNVNLSIPINEVKPYLSESLNMRLSDFKDDKPPIVPQGVEMHLQHIIWWDVYTEEDLAGYYVYASDEPDGSFNRVKNLNGDELFIRAMHLPYSPEEEKTMYYYVTALDANGNESPASTVVSIIPLVGEPVILSDGRYFFGELLNGVPNGPGVMFSYDNGLYKGDFKDGLKHGQGTFSWIDGTEYSGQWLRDLRNGQGTILMVDGSKYSGAWVDDVVEGYGTYIWPDGTEYSGDWQDGLEHGQGTLSWPDGRKYIGQWRDGNRDGKGKIFRFGEVVYDGEWLNDKRHGQGTFIWSDGQRYSGRFTNGEITGYGTMTWPDGMGYTGYFVDLYREGEGTMTWPDGRKYQGDWTKDVMEGQGTMIWGDGKKYVGEWNDNKRHGQGTLYDTDGSIIYEGTWDNGVQILE